MTIRTRQSALSVVLLPLALLALPGCGGGEKTARLTGKVTYKDKAVAGGWVSFVNEANSKSQRAQTDADGNYTAADLPYGTLKVAVEPAPAPPTSKMPKGTKIPENAPNYTPQGGGTYVDIPPAFRNPETSKITVTIDGTNKPFNIDIPSK